MDAAPSLHPTDQTLSAYGLGKLDDCSAEAVNEHLMLCSDCRKRVAEMSADSFLQRVRDAQKPSGKSTSGPTQAGGTQGGRGAPTLTSSTADSIPPELATHPDYQIKKELGRGGMGVVYLAHNTLMKRDEVLKVMGQHLMERSGVLERFLREIQSVARLRHPNIVTAYHATRLGPSIIFAMEYVEGLDLSKLVKAKGPMPVAHACLFIHQAALGLQHAHEEGLVHRDIKPHNLMLSRKGDKATVKILDFGLAKAAREEKVEGGLTATGQALGTPDYIAPEQILDAPTADIRADIYSLGGTLYYLLTGHPPFQAKSLYDLYQAHISRDADPLNLVRPEVPAELAALVAKMMAKEPSRRFQTPGEVAQALTPFFKKGNAALKIPQADISQAGPASAGRSVAEAVSAATQLETDSDRLKVRPKKAAGPSGAESRWESMIDFREAESTKEAEPEVAPRGRPPWVWSSVVVGVLMLGFFATWLGGVFKVKTSDGVIVLENVPKDSEILVDGDKVNVTWPGLGKPLEIRAVPGQHKVEVKKDGFTTFGEVVTIKTDESEEVAVRLEPLVVVRPEPKKEVAPEPIPDKVPERKTEVVVPQPANAVPNEPKEITNSIKMKLVLIPSGEFLMGSPHSDGDAGDSARPQHRVKITRPFYLGATEVTQRQYQAVMGQNPSKFKFKGSDNLPVEQVTWSKAMAFCDKLCELEEGQLAGARYRLPTEAEWEYACRAKSPARYSFGDDPAGLGEYAWFVGNAGLRTHPVGQKRPNAFGLFDMHGNVWEWCFDGRDGPEDDFYKRSPVDDPVCPGWRGSLRQFRGGSWRDDPRPARSATRACDGPDDTQLATGGFRVARDLRPGNDEALASPAELPKAAVPPSPTDASGSMR